MKVRVEEWKGKVKVKVKMIINTTDVHYEYETEWEWKWKQPWKWREKSEKWKRKKSKSKRKSESKRGNKVKAKVKAKLKSSASMRANDPTRWSSAIFNVDTLSKQKTKLNIRQLHGIVHACTTTANPADAQQTKWSTFNTITWTPPRAAVTLAVWSAVGVKHIACSDVNHDNEYHSRARQQFTGLGDARVVDLFRLERKQRLRDTNTRFW